MKKLLFPVAVIFLLVGCRGSKLGYKTEKEVTIIKVRKGIAIDPMLLAAQTDQHETAMRGGGSRGLLIPDPTGISSIVIDYGIASIKNAIENEKAKYQAVYNYVLSADDGRRVGNDSMYFYSDVSSSGPFDVNDMQFTGFSVARLYNEDDTPMVAMKADFELDTANLYEIKYDGIFRLRLKKIELNYAKAKVPHGREKINMDIQVQVLASYLTKEGQMHFNDTIGRFETLLNGVTLQNADSCKRFANTRMKGWSFIVPRSYCHDRHGQEQWNQGSYKVCVTITEISDPKKVDGWIFDNGGDVLDQANTLLGTSSGN